VEFSLLWLIIILAIVLALFGGVGYGYRDRWGAYYGGGVGLIFLVLAVVFMIWALGGFDGGANNTDGRINIDL